MNLWKVIFATIVIFGTGVFSGGLLVNYVDHSHPGNHRAQPAQPPREPQDIVARPEILKTNFIQNLDSALHLSPDQRAQIDKIVAEGQDRNRQLWLQVAPQIRNALQDTRQRIRATLNDEQKKQFEDLLRRGHRVLNPTNAPPEVPTNSVPTNSITL
ncbi:MAG TPA: hypothetical protein VGI03_09275 [Verrucomicrobiae bacterium]